MGKLSPCVSFEYYSKVFERVVYDQMKTYLDEKKLLYKFQPGFRTRFSTDTWLIHFTDFIKIQTDKGILVCMVLLDPQKALTLWNILFY